MLNGKIRRLPAVLAAASLLLGIILTPIGGAVVRADEPGIGDLAHEGFDAIITGGKPGGTGWSYKETNGTVAVAEVPDAANKSLEIDRTATDTGTNLYARYATGSALTGQYVVRTKVMAAQTDATVIALQLRSSDNKELAVVTLTSDGNIRYQQASSTVVVQPYSAGVWYDVAVAVDTAAQQYILLIDGVSKVGPVAFKSADAHDLKQVDFQVYRTTPGVAYFDDFDLYTQSVSLNESTATLPIGQSESLAASVLPAIDGLQAVTWTSSDPSVVRVDAGGTITAWGYGTATVTATSPGGASADCAVTVPAGPDVPVTGLTLEGGDLTLDAGESRDVSATLEPFYATDQAIAWTSSNPSVVSVVYSVYSGTATLTALQPGTSIIAATSDDGDYSGHIQVTVLASGDLFAERFESYSPGTKPSTLSIPTVAGVTAAVADNPYSPGRSFKIDKSAETASSYLVSRTISAGHEKVKVSLRAMAKQTDAVVYTAVVRNSSGASVLYADFHSNGKISIMNGGSWEAIEPYEANRWYRFDLILDASTDTYDLYIDGVPKRLGLAMIQPADEIRNVQFGMYGAAVGTAYFDDLEFFSYRAVTGFDLLSIPTVLALNDTIALKPNFTPADATFTAVQWASSNPGVVAVDDLGNATGVTEGTATLTGTTVDGGLVDSVAIEVVEKHPTGVSISPAALTLPLGSDRALTAAVLPADASNRSVAWSSSNPSVASVDEEGRVTATGIGTAEITAETEDGGLTASIEAEVVARTVQAAYYVSPDGSDSNSGTEALPFRTLEKARDAVRTINADMTGDIVVYLRGGDYPLTTALQLDERDSGSNGYWIIYRAYEDEQPVIEGGRTIGGWTLYDAGNGIYRASAGGDLETRQLFVNGVRAVRARSEGGLTNPQKTATGYVSDDVGLASWNNIGDLEFVYKAEWTNPRDRVQSVTVQDGQAVIAMQQPGWNYVTVRSSVVNPWYLENAYELLDQPGEWYLDRTTDMIYYKPRTGENMSTADVVAPVAEQLVNIAGTTLDTPADGIRFEGLTFAYTTWNRPSSDLGHADAQNNLLRYGTDKLPPGAIMAEKASHIVFENNTFTKLGITAITMTGAVQHSLIRGNRFYDISGSAIDVGEVTKSDPDIYAPSDPRKVLKNIDIENNYIHDIGVDYRSAAAIGLGFVADSDIRHNEIFNVPYDGITIGYGFGYVTTSALRNNKIQANFIHDLLGEQIYDGGAIYTLGGTGGTADHKNVISDNYVRNQMNRYGVIYNDEGSTYWQVEHNVIDQSETPVWDEIFPVSWAFVNGPLTSHDITFDTNYTTTARAQMVGVNVSQTGTQVYPDAQWPSAAQAIIASAGLEPAYRHLADDMPERIVLPKKLDLASGDDEQLEVTATTGKDVPVDLSGADITYVSADENVAQVSVTGSVYAAGPGHTDIRVSVQVGDMRWTKNVPVYVDDAFDHIDVYYVENKAKHLLGEEYTAMLGVQRPLTIEAKSLYGQTMTVSSAVYTSSDPAVATIDAQGVLSALSAGSADLEFALAVNGVPHTRTIGVSVLSFGDPAGLEYDAYPLDDAINDPDHWYVYSTGVGSLLPGSDNLTISTPGGFATYEGDTYGDELLTTDLQINSSGGWPSLAIRVQQPEEAFTSATNDLYLFCFKEDVIELHRFNGGVRTVIYGNLDGYTSIGGQGIPNQYIPFGERHRVQVGAVNEAGGVRLILNIDDENVIYFLDTGAERIEDSGYFGLYSRSGSMKLLSPEME
ncbi:Ig-like domain-containing protein [Cohnella fermenti]|nr:Ig-like domain-containing protein [Cohnella fermenti]